MIGDPYKIALNTEKKSHTKRTMESTNYIKDQTHKNYADRLVRDSYIKAEQIIKNAEVKKKSIIQASYKEVESAKKEGYEEGVKIGVQKGYEAGIRKSRDIIDEAIQIKREYILKRQEVIKESEKEIIEFSIKIAEKILGEILDDHKEYIVNMVLAGLEKAGKRNNIIIRCPANFYDVLVSQKNDILKRIKNLDEINIIKDPGLSTGDCIISSSIEEIDVSIKEQLDIILQSLGEEIGKKQTMS